MKILVILTSLGLGTAALVKTVDLMNQATAIVQDATRVSDRSDA